MNTKQLDNLALAAAVVTLVVGVMLLMDGVGCYELSTLTHYALVAAQIGAVSFIVYAAP